MGLRRLPVIIIVGSALAIVASSASASPGDLHAGAMQQGEVQMPSPEFRDSWIAECSDRLADGGRHHRYRGPDERCARYFDSYYEYYRSYRPSYGYGYGYGHQGAAIVPAGSCGHAMTTPAVRTAPCKPECTETVEYEYVDVPVRRRAPPVPDKRVKIVRDKRIKVK